MPYEQVTRDIAEKEGIHPLFDLNRATTAFYIRKGEKAIGANEERKDRFYPLEPSGGTEIGRLVAELSKETIPDLAPYIR